MKFTIKMNMDLKSNTPDRLTNFVFISASIIFNVFVSALYIAVKLDNQFLVTVFGVIIVSTAIPFLFTFVKYWKSKAEKKIIVSHGFILFYLFLEILLDYILKIPFREILAIHIPYIIFFYGATFSMIGVSFTISKKMGFVVSATFLVLIGCLIYLYS